LVQSRFGITLITLIEMQLLIIAITLPILVYAGLPVSYMSIIGNIVLAPLFIGYFLVTSVVFIFEIMQLPNTTIIYIMEHLNQLIYWCVHVKSPSLVAFHSPPWYVCILLGICVLILLHVKVKTPLQRIAFFLAFFFLFPLYSYIWARQSPIIHFNKNSNHFTVIKTSKGLIGIDHGMRIRPSTLTWFKYHISPKLRKHYGTTALYALIFLKPTTPSLLLSEYMASNHLCTYYYVPQVKRVKTTTKPPTAVTVITLTDAIQSLCEELNINLKLVPFGTLYQTRKLSGKEQHVRKEIGTVFCIRGNIDNNDVNITPRLTPRELVQPLPPQLIREDTPVYTSPVQPTPGAVLQ